MTSAPSQAWGVIFDFGGVLSSSVGSRDILGPAARELGLEEEELVQRLFSGEAWEQASRGEISPAAYWTRVTAGLGAAGPPAELAPFADNPFFGEYLDEEVVSLLHAVRARGHRTALCSNALPGLLYHLAQRPEVFLAFDVVVISALVGSRKPEEAIFHTTLARLRLPPERCIFIDDRERNLETARRLGLHTHLFTGAGEAEQALRALHIL